MDGLCSRYAPPNVRNAKIVPTNSHRNGVPNENSGRIACTIRSNAASALANRAPNTTSSSRPRPTEARTRDAPDAPSLARALARPQRTHGSDRNPASGRFSTAMKTAGTRRPAPTASATLPNAARTHSTNSQPAARNTPTDSSATVAALQHVASIALVPRCFGSMRRMTTSRAPTSPRPAIGQPIPGRSSGRAAAATTAATSAPMSTSGPAAVLRCGQRRWNSVGFGGPSLIGLIRAGLVPCGCDG